MGVMLYLMVAGVYPFEDPNNPDNVACTLQNVRDGRIRPLPADVSHQCADLIVRMLHKKSAKRLTLDKTLLHPWIALNSSPSKKRASRKPSSGANAASAQPTRDELKKITKRASDLKRERTDSLHKKHSAAVFESIDKRVKSLSSGQSKSLSSSAKSASFKSADSKTSSSSFNKLMSRLGL